MKTNIRISDSKKNWILRFIFIFTFVVYLISMTRTSLFKYVPISEIFSADRFYSQSVNFIPFHDWFVNRVEMIRDFILNMIMYFPFGFLLQMTHRKSKISTIAIIIPMISSVILEALQYFFSLGATDINDVISNTLGAFTGALAYCVFNRVFITRNRKTRERLIYFLGIVAVIEILTIL